MVSSSADDRSPQPAIRLLVVTRESEADKRYGLGRSLRPVLECLESRAHQLRYLSKSDWGVRGERWIVRMHRMFSAVFSSDRHATLRALAWALLERLNMGRLAAKVAQRDGYTHVHLHDPWLAAGYWLFRPAGVRWGLTEHGFGSYARATHEDGLPHGPATLRHLHRLEAAVLRRADWVIAPTAAALEQLARDLALPSIQHHWHVVPHARPVLAPGSRAQARQQLGLSGDTLQVLGIGRLAPLKRFEWLVAACAKLLAEGIDLRLTILGGGDAVPLRQLADSLGFGDRLTVTVTDDVSAYLRAADAYVSTSSTESFGLANLEALVAGVPALCTAVGGVAEVVGVSEALLAADGSDLEPALRRVLTDGEWRRRLTEQCAARGASWPDAMEVAKRYERIYLALA